MANPPLQRHQAAEICAAGPGADGGWKGASRPLRETRSRSATENWGSQTTASRGDDGMTPLGCSALESPTRPSRIRHCVSLAEALLAESRDHAGV